MRLPHDDCKTCGLFKTCRTPFMAGVGKRRPELVVVAEAPGGHEDEVSGKPMSGEAGQIMASAVADAGWDVGRTCRTNANRCRPVGNATPSMGQIRACRPLLLDELNRWKAPVIVAMGQTAARSLTNNGSLRVKDARLRTLTVPGLEYEPKLVTATYHGAWVIHKEGRHPGGFNLSKYRKTGAYRQLVEDLTWAYNAARHSPIVSHESTMVNPDTLRHLVSLKKGSPCSVDFEFVGHDRIVSMAVSYRPRRSLVMLVDTPLASHTPMEAIETIRWLFKRPYSWTSHSVITELVMAERVGAVPNTEYPTHCTLVGLQFVDENAPNKDLEYWALKVCNMNDYAARMRPFKRRSKREFPLLAPADVLVEYNGGDAVAALRLREWQEDQGIKTL